MKEKVLASAALVLLACTPAMAQGLDDVKHKFASVSGIVQDKCMACHSRGYDLPFYAKVPGISAIIEKDRAAGLLAKETDADVLMFLTGVDNVSLNYGTDHEVHLDKVTAADADRYAKEGQFSAGSMLPKIEASIDFINAGKGRHAIITSMDMAKDALAGRGGTTIA